MTSDVIVFLIVLAGIVVIASIALWAIDQERQRNNENLRLLDELQRRQRR